MSFRQGIFSFLTDCVGMFKSLIIRNEVDLREKALIGVFAVEGDAEEA